MSDLKAAPAEVRCTVCITRKATGLVETFELVGHLQPPEPEAHPPPPPPEPEG